MSEKFWSLVHEWKVVLKELTQVRSQLKLLKEREKFLAAKADELQNKVNDEPSEDKISVKGLNLTDSITTILSNAKAPLLPSEILLRIEEGGYKTNSSDPYASLLVMCKKLSDRGILKETVKDGLRAFTLK